MPGSQPTPEEMLPRERRTTPIDQLSFAERWRLILYMERCFRELDAIERQHLLAKLREADQACTEREAAAGVTRVGL